MEVFLLKSYHLDSRGDIYFTTTILALIVFLASLLIKQEKPNVWSKLGEEYSLYIYVLHLAVRDTLNIFNHKFMPSEWTDGIYLYAAPFVVLVVTIAATYVLKKVRIVK